jgi:hypothetical protein
MKVPLFTFFALTLLSSLIAVSSTTVNVFFNPNTIEAQRGKEYIVSIKVEPGDLGLSGGEISLKVDPSAIKLMSVEVGELMGSNPLVGINKVDVLGGTAVLAVARIGLTTKPTPPGNILTLKFKVADDAKIETYTIKVEKLGFTDNNIMDISSDWIKISDCVVKVLEPSQTDSWIGSPFWIILLTTIIGASIAILFLQKKIQL